MRMSLAMVGLILLLTAGAPMPHAFAQSTVSPQRPGDPGYDALLDAATAPLREAVGDRLRLDVERLDRVGRWAFLLATMRAPEGGRPDLTGTVYAERAASGGMSDVYVVLLRAAPGDDEAHDANGTPLQPGADAEASASNIGPGSPAEQATEWRVIDHAVGPSDVAWLEWPDRHAAPRHLFGF